MSTLTAESEQETLGLLCHCTGDEARHDPGADGFGCKPIRAVRIQPLGTGSTPAEITTELVRTAATPADRERWEGVAAIHRSVDETWAELERQVRQNRRALKIEKDGQRWAIKHVASNTVLLAGFVTKSKAEAVQGWLLTQDVDWSRDELRPHAFAVLLDRANSITGTTPGPWAAQRGRRWVMA